MNETDDFDFEMADAPVASNPKPVTQPVLASGDDDADDFMADMGITHERTVPDITKPWMKHHKFELIQTIDRLNEVIDAAIAAGECALDLECEGLDNRIFYREDGSPYTKHNIVGFCLSYDGITGFYAPIRHKPDDSGTDLNLPIAETEAAIKRLCVAAQPVVSPKGLEEDPLAAKEIGKDGTPNWLEKPKLVIYFWHAKFDQEFLYPITGIDWWHPESFEDGNLIYFVHFSGDKALSLKDKAKQELRDIDGNAYEMIKLQELFIQGRKGIHFEKLAPDEPGCVKYACSDGICTYLLCTMPRAHETNRKPIAKIVREKYHHTYRIEKQTSETGRWMERPRVRVNKAKIEAMRVANLEKRDEIANKIASIVIANGFPPLDIASPKQLGEFLFSEKGLNISMPVSSQDWPGGKPPLLEKSGQYSTNADTLERMALEHPSPPEVLKLVVEWRELDKLNGTYLDNMVNNVDERGEMRFQFKQTGAQTGRYSAPAGDPAQGYSGIPIHGIPGTSALRQAFEARPGYTFVKTDYAAQELRIAANVSGEEVWIKEFLEGDGDLHSITARAFFGKSVISKEERKMGKISNFALVYGGGPAAIMRACGCDKVEATRRKQAFDKSVPTFAKWVKVQHRKVKETNGIWNALGRWIAIPPPKSDLPPDEIRKQEAARERAATNFPIQSVGSDIMKIALILLNKEFYQRGWLRQNNGDDSVRMLLTVHDEIVFEIRNDRVQEVIPILESKMVTPGLMATPKWRVPLTVESTIGLNWGGECNYEMLVHGKPHTPEHKFNEKLEVIIDNRVYHQVPPWLDGLFIPPYANKGSTPPKGSSGGEGPPITTTTAAASIPSPVSQPVTGSTLPSAGVVHPAPPVNYSDIIVIKIGLLNKRTVKQVGVAIAVAADPDAGKVLCLTDASGHELIPPARNIRVLPELFRDQLVNVNLTDGTIMPYSVAGKS